MTEILQSILIYAVPAILAITLHEAAHGFVAKRLGDNTAWILGRVTMNPLKHIDPVGTILVPGLLLVGSMIAGGAGFLFGWAKPVPVNFSRLYNPKRDMIWVTLAGPGMNIAQMFCWLIVLKIIVLGEPSGMIGQTAVDICLAGVSVNMILAAFNLLPILPMDGGRVLAGLLPWRQAVAYSRLEPYGLLIVIILLATGILNYFLRPFMQLAQTFVEWTVML